MQYKRFFFFSLFLLFFTTLMDAQTAWNTQRLDINKKAMTVLGGWAVGNMALGAAMMGRKQGEDRYFHQMNLAWNAVNFGIATLGYWQAQKTDPAALDLYQSIQQQHGIQKVLLFNAGLDIGYMLGGAYLMERSKNTAKLPERLRGFGKSIVLQGGFLLLFDVTVFSIHNSHNAELKEWLSHLQLSSNGIGFVMRW
mgnify:CR=1 FL=1